MTIFNLYIHQNISQTVAYVIRPVIININKKNRISLICWRYLL